MASECEFSSDSIDGYITKISGDDIDYLKERVAKHLLEAKNLSAEIHHVPGQPARLYINDGSSSDSQVVANRDSNKLLVTNLPESADEEHLEMFFEHTKRQGGGLVKKVQLYQDMRQAVVEFEEVDAVQRVLNKQPIKMLGTTVKVERYEPYLDKDETLKCIEIGGIQTDLVKEIADMKLKHKEDNEWDNDLNDTSMRIGSITVLHGDSVEEEDSDEEDDLFSVKTPPKKSKKFEHYGIVCDGCDEGVFGIRYRCTRCRDFDFCSSCKNKIYHNPTHKFKKIIHPAMH